MYVQCEKYNDLQLQQLYVYVSDFLSCPPSYLQHQYNTVVFCQPPLITLASDLGRGKYEPGALFTTNRLILARDVRYLSTAGNEGPQKFSQLRRRRPLALSQLRMY